MLDCVTGELQGGAMSTQHPQIHRQFTYSNSSPDLDIKNVKNPRFLMVTGHSTFPRGRQRHGKAVLYIAELKVAR